MWKKISGVLGALILIGSLVGGMNYFDIKYAKADDVKANRIDIRINQLRNDIRWYQDQMVYIMTRCGKRNPSDLPPDAYNNYTHYEVQKNSLEKELDILMQKRNRF